MVANCANPTCTARFRYFHEGRLFVFEKKPHGPNGGSPSVWEGGAGFRIPRCYWLCSSCCSEMTLRPNGDYGLVLLSKRAVREPVFVTDEAGVAA